MISKSPVRRIVRLMGEALTLGAFALFFMQQVAGWAWGVAFGAAATLVQMFYRRHDIAAGWRQHPSRSQPSHWES